MAFSYKPRRRPVVLLAMGAFFFIATVFWLLSSSAAGRRLWPGQNMHWGGWEEVRYMFVL